MYYKTRKNTKREKYYLIANSLLNENSSINENSVFANVDLVYYCLSNKSISVDDIREKIDSLMSFNKKNTLDDIDDSPVEAFYCASDHSYLGNYR